jgi:hypothetical protein
MEPYLKALRSSCHRHYIHVYLANIYMSNVFIILERVRRMKFWHRVNRHLSVLLWTCLPSISTFGLFLICMQIKQKLLCAAFFRNSELRNDAEVWDKAHWKTCRGNWHNGPSLQLLCTCVIHAHHAHIQYVFGIGMESYQLACTCRSVSSYLTLINY